MTDPTPVAAREHIATHTTPTRIIPSARRFEYAVHATVGAPFVILTAALIIGGAL